jgi:hypothetical protein
VQRDDFNKTKPQPSSSAPRPPRKKRMNPKKEGKDTKKSIAKIVKKVK